VPEPGVALHPAPAVGAGQAGTVHARLEAAFRALDASSVPWCLLRGEDELADAGGDVDLLIDAHVFAGARDVLSALGFAHVPAPGRGPHRFLVAYDEDGDRWIKLDVVLELAYGSHQELVAPGAAAAVLGRRRRDGTVWLPSPHDAFWTLLLHALLDRSGVRGHDVERLSELAGAAGEGPPPELRGILSPDDERAVAGLAATRAVSGLNAVSARTRAAAARRHRGRIARRRLARRLSRRSGLLGRRGIVVALLGPDGAGKSSLAGGIAGAFPVSVHRVYGGLYARGRRTRIPLFGRIAQSVRLGLEARAARTRGRVVVFDRHPYDALVAPRRPVGTMRRVRRRLLARSAVRPDLVLLLDASPEVLYARKAEHDVDELERQRRAYRALEAQLPQLATVDVGREPDVIRREATRLIWHRYAQRGSRR
jgi:thymidylate kinase